MIPFRRIDTTNRARNQLPTRHISKAALYKPMTIARHTWLIQVQGNHGSHLVYELAEFMQFVGPDESHDAASLYWNHVDAWFYPSAKVPTAKPPRLSSIPERRVGLRLIFPLSEPDHFASSLSLLASLQPSISAWACKPKPHLRSGLVPLESS